MTETLNTIITLVTLAGLFSPLVVQVINWLKLRSKNERVRLALTFAEQVVHSIEEANAYLPESKKNEAIKMLNQRLKDNGIDKQFNREQLEAYINQVREEDY